MTTLVAEISHTYRPDRIELESPNFMCFSHGSHHEKDGLGLLLEDDFLLSLCFCLHCLTRATATGIDAKVAQMQVAALLDAAFAREMPQAQFPDFPAKGIDAFARYPAILAYLLWRTEPVTSLIAEIKLATHPGNILLLIDAAGTWTGGIDLPTIIPHIDGTLHCAYFTASNQINALMAQTRALLGPDKALIAGFQIFYPNVADVADLQIRVAQTVPHVDGLNFYNRGLVPPARFCWIAQALATLRN